MIAESLGYSKGSLAVFQVGNGHCLLTASAPFPDLFAWHLTSVAWPGFEQNLEPRGCIKLVKHEIIALLATGNAQGWVHRRLSMTQQSRELPEWISKVLVLIQFKQGYSLYPQRF